MIFTVPVVLTSMSSLALAGAFTTKPPPFLDQRKSHSTILAMAPKLSDKAATAFGKEKQVEAADIKDVYLFNEGNKSMREILGGKGANLAEMVRRRHIPYAFCLVTCEFSFLIQTTLMVAFYSQILDCQYHQGLQSRRRSVVISSNAMNSRQTSNKNTLMP